MKGHTLNDIKNALSFLSVIRLKTKEFDGNRAAYAFAYAGLIIGCVAAFVFFLLKGRVSDLSVGVMVTVVLALITGGLHLDGLADTADGVFSGRELKRKLEIMKDSRTGSMGVIAICLVLLAKTIFISEITHPFAIVLSVGLARYAAIFSMYFLPYARETGTAGAFMGGFDETVFVQGALPLICILYFGFSELLIISTVFFLSAAFLIRYYKRSIGGVTGDMLGFEIEVMETLLLFVFGAVL